MATTRPRFYLFAFLLLVVTLALVWFAVRRGVDPVTVMPLNNKGVGLMERFEYEEAVGVFEEVVRLAPDWLPGRINLGIALLNAGGTSNPELLQRTRETFEEVLKRDPDNPHAHHCLGVLLTHQKDAREAIRHFEAVTKIDPGDASAWFFLGLLLDDAPQRSECFRKALARDPYHIGALYQIGLELVRDDPKKGQEFLDTFEALKRSEWGNPTAIKYTEMGRYGEVIGSRSTATPRTGPLPRFVCEPLKVTLAKGVKWNREYALGRGGTLVTLDFDGDGRPDLFLAQAVIDNGKERDLLLQNTPGGFVDVTRAWGIDPVFRTRGITVADLDNDGRPDLLLTGDDGVRLYRNTGKGQFEDLTVKAGLSTLKGAYTSAACVDLDQDSDLDLIFLGTSGVVVSLHVGEAPPAPPGQKMNVPLVCKYRVENLPALDLKVPVATMVVADVDDDRDVDVVLLPDGDVPQIVRNDRLLRFERLPLDTPAAAWIGGLALDVKHRGRSDLFLLPSGQPPRLLHPVAQGKFDKSTLHCPPFVHAVAVDLDLDSWTDVVGLSDNRQLVLLHNDGGKLVHRRDAFVGCALPERVEAFLPLVLDCSNNDPQPDLIVLSQDGLSRVRPVDPKNHGLLIRLNGRMGIDPGGAPVRCNADAVGTFVLAQAGDVWSGIENTTLSAGWGQSRSSLLLGLGRHRVADVVRLRWPDGTVQAELNVEGCVTIKQANRKKTSCPVLFTWNGERFVFVTDFLGEGSLGELGPDGRTRPPRPEESVKIEAEQLAIKDGRYEIELAEPMDEITYLDALHLAVVDHPANMAVYPDERFATGGKPPTQELLAFDHRILPLKATDHRGVDVTATLRDADRRTVDSFAKRAWIGFAEDHHVTLDFGDRLSKMDKKDRVYLCLYGWTDYPFPESIWAANQAGLAMRPPVLKRERDDGTWEKIADVGFPAGLPKMMLLDVTGLSRGEHGKLRIETNMHVYWDQVYLAVRKPLPAPERVLPVESATLSACGLHQEYSPDGRLPTIYAHDRFDSVPVVRQVGRLTRHGDVTELLTERDDRFVIFGPNDRLRVGFDARTLPALPTGWKRSFVLRTQGYCKDAGPFTATGMTVEPLPFRAMRQYPPGKDERQREDAEYRRRFQTREVR